MLGRKHTWLMRIALAVCSGGLFAAARADELPQDTLRPLSRLMAVRRTSAKR